MKFSFKTAIYTAGISALSFFGIGCNRASQEGESVRFEITSRGQIARTGEQHYYADLINKETGNRIGYREQFNVEPNQQQFEVGDIIDADRGPGKNDNSANKFKNIQLRKSPQERVVDSLTHELSDLKNTATQQHKSDSTAIAQEKQTSQKILDLMKRMNKRIKHVDNLVSSEQNSKINSR